MKPTPKLDAPTVIPVASVIGKYLAPKPFNNQEIKQKVISLIDKSLLKSEDKTIAIESVADLERLVKLRILLQSLYPDIDESKNNAPLLDMNNPLVQQLTNELFNNLNDRNSE